MRVEYLLLAVLAILSSGYRLQGQEARTASLTILHWNDFHAQNFPFEVRSTDSPNDTAPHLVGGTSALLGYINEFRHENPNILVLNAGDDVQGTPISTLTFGRSQVELMNLIHPDAATLGNHEFDYGGTRLRENMALAAYPITCANVVSTGTDSTIALPFLTKMLNGIQIAIIGVAPIDLELLTLKSNLAGFQIRNIDSTLDRSISEIKTTTHPNLILLLSHLGFDQDTLLAARRRDIDIIVGGHSHTALFSPFRKNRTIIVQAGSRGQYLGELDVTVDLGGDSVLSYGGKLIETKVDGTHAEPAAEKLVESFETVVNERFGETIGTLLTRWDRKDGRKTEINVGDFQCDVMRATTRTNIAFHNVGGIRKDLDPGPIKVRDIWEMNPFGNTFVTFTVHGDTLRRMLEWQASVRPREFAQVAGVRYVYDSSKPAGSRVISVEVDGNPCRDTSQYSVCTNNYIGSHLYDFFGIRDSLVAVEETGLVDRDVLIDYIRHHPAISSSVEGRIIDRAGLPTNRR